MLTVYVAVAAFLAGHLLTVLIVCLCRAAASRDVERGQR
jgi:hypothetical protein